MLKIGIDTSTTNTAIVALNLRNELVGFILLSPKDKDIYDRSTTICKLAGDYIDKLVSNNEGQIRYGIEGASFGSIGKKDKLVMLMGYIFYMLKLDECDVKILPPSTIKKQFTGRGRASKEEVIATVPEEVMKQFRASHKKVDDLADAYAIASIL